MGGSPGQAMDGVPLVQIEKDDSSPCNNRTINITQISVGYTSDITTILSRFDKEMFFNGVICKIFLTKCDQRYLYK
jgi:hypothetical protein